MLRRPSLASPEGERVRRQRARIRGRETNHWLPALYLRGLRRRDRARVPRGRTSYEDRNRASLRPQRRPPHCGPRCCKRQWAEWPISRGVKTFLCAGYGLDHRGGRCIALPCWQLPHRETRVSPTGPRPIALRQLHQGCGGLPRPYSCSSLIAAASITFARRRCWNESLSATLALEVGHTWELRLGFIAGSAFTGPPDALRTYAEGQQVLGSTRTSRSV